jgi:hypothetical protein
MHLLEDHFNTLRQKLGHGRAVGSTGTEPIFYLVFPPNEIIRVKTALSRTWVHRLENDGWHVVTCSLADAIESTLRSNKLRKLWLIEEKRLLAQSESARTAFDSQEVNQTLRKALSKQSSTSGELTIAPELAAHLDQAMTAAESVPNGLLLLTDLEALHPYLRINTIEAYLTSRVRRPVVVFYPGTRAGATSLKFLDFYPADPNYRSDHIG